ncbi:glycosyltransferase family 2 protein [Flavihumibacter petaseus]|uniref:Putative glycosyltransferase n=1 Tax=Flavihumibacter petaseus NBRC 106054 TaxID=1220578 RepID=A0A0E9N774_9BACT|nr:glycosyltransferase family 2 protein [Flavihumibacter petaseus]GAO45200.1 putative glycosyltransferase [Flavihumibacter petaseus NBRC 106054]
MPDQPEIKITVVTCFLNEERFLEEAIASVIGQTYSNWELILIDDGSSDNSRQIAEAYVLAHPGKIFYYDHPGHANKGLSASRNSGIRKATGEWIALLDADDVWYADKLENQVGIIQRYPGISMLCEASNYWNSWNDAPHADHIIEVGDGLEGLMQPPDLLSLLYPLGAGSAPCPSAILIKQSAWEKVNGFQENFDGIYQMYEDQAFLCKIYLTETVYISRSCHNNYRQRIGSLVQDVTATGKYDTVRLFFLSWFQGWLLEQRNENKKIQSLLQQALRPRRQPLVLQLKRLIKKAIGSLKSS